MFEEKYQTNVHYFRGYYYAQDTNHDGNTTSQIILSDSAIQGITISYSSNHIVRNIH